MTGDVLLYKFVMTSYVLYKLLENDRQILFAAQQKIRAPQSWRTKVTVVYLIIHDRVTVIQKVNSGSALWKMENVLMAKCDRPVQTSPVHSVCFRYSGGTTEASQLFACFTLTFYSVTAVRKLISKTESSEHGYLSDKLHGIIPLEKASPTYNYFIHKLLQVSTYWIKALV